MSRQPNYEFQEWWNRERERAFLSPSVIDDTTTSTSSSSSSPPPPNSNWANTTPPTTPASASAASNGKGKNRRSARQLSWLICLRLHHSLSILFTLPSRLLSLFSTAIRRISSSSSSSSRDSSSSSLLYRIIRAFLVLAILLFIFEVAAYFKGWHLTPPSYASSAHALEILYANWLHIRANYLAPPLQAMANVCILLFLLQSLDRILLMLGCAWIRFKGIKPVAAAAAAAVNYNNNINSSPSSATVVNGDVEQGCACLIHHHYYPMVLLQIPMCNEREVYQQSIAAVCIQDWPRERMLVQVLDDSDDIDVQQLIKAEVQKWQQKGINIVYRHRLIRTGYKAGNLKSAMSCDYVNDYEFVAIFDADFQPGQDFLKRTIPHFKGNDDLALVQTRWAFVNKDENLLTRLQNINLSFHFEVEQQVNGLLLNFFGFNGTAGVWRIKALEESGGWLERTTVEDMDIAVRAHLCGWKFIFLNDVKSLCELPESYAAYKKQQHRWHSGPMQLFRLCFMDILRSKVSVLKKANLIFLFFLLRKLILPFYSFTLFCIILPLTMFLPEAQLPTWVVCYVPGIMSIINILPAPRSFPFLVPYLLFENTMSVTKFNAMISGLFKLGSSYEWVVTKKLGRSSEADLTVFTEKESETQSTNGGFHRATSESGLAELTKLEMSKKAGKTKRNRLYRKELTLAFILLTAAARSLLSAQGIHFYFLLFQGITFLVVGLDLIGEQVS